MLVLSRRRNERIMIGDDISIMIVDIRGDKVRIGIEAPASVQVHRKEVFDAIHRAAEPEPGITEHHLTAEDTASEQSLQSAIKRIVSDSADEHSNHGSY